MVFKLKSSDKIFLENGKVREKVLSDLIREAYYTLGLYDECKILVTQKNDANYSGKKLVFVEYKELWDIYTCLTGKEDYHPYEKKHQTLFTLENAFRNSQEDEQIFDELSFFNSLGVGDVKFTKKGEDEEKENQEKIKQEPERKIPGKRGRKKKQKSS